MKVIDVAREVRYDKTKDRVEIGSSRPWQGLNKHQGTTTDVVSAVAHRDRKPYFVDALARLVARGDVIAEGNTFRLKSS